MQYVHSVEVILMNEPDFFDADPLCTDKGGGCYTKQVCVTTISVCTALRNLTHFCTCTQAYQYCLLISIIFKLVNESALGRKSLMALEVTGAV